jgi:hypothetical protein
MSTSFEDNIKAWVQLDDKIKKHNEVLKELRQRKTELQEKIHVYVEEKNLGHATVQISDGKLKFHKSKVTQPLTLKYIQECLEKCISNENDVTKIMSIIKNNRENKFVNDIKRTFD